MYWCKTCGEVVTGYSNALKHSKNGHKTQRAAFQAGERHTLELVTATELDELKTRGKVKEGS